MSGRTAHVLVLSDTGTAELFSEGRSLWASDADPELLDVLGTEAIESEDIGAVLRYLMDEGLLSEAEAHACAIDSPDDEDEDEDADESEDEDEDEDEDDTVEVSP